jgi:hypothetical protein
MAQILGEALRSEVLTMKWPPLRMMMVRGSNAPLWIIVTIRAASSRAEVALCGGASEGTRIFILKGASCGSKKRMPQIGRYAETKDYPNAVEFRGIMSGCDVPSKESAFP